MNKRANLPVEGKAIRFAPGEGQEPAASFWKVWAEGNEIYASSRSPGGSAKISVHASGQIHYRLEAKLKQDLAQLMQLSSGPWFHALEIRFLQSEGTNAPFRQRESLKNKSGYLIAVPKGFILYANLIVGAPGTPLTCPLPAEFLPTGQALWRTRLRDGRPAVLVARLLELDSQNRDHIKYLREELKPTATFSTMPSERYVQLVHLYWSPEGGNVVLVVPMGDEAFRSEQEVIPLDGLALDTRTLLYRSPRSTAEVVAPNGLRVAVLELDEVDKQIELIKDQPSTHEVGTLRMRIEPHNLISGGQFMASPCTLVCIPSVGGGCPRTWEYTVVGRFDGFALSTELRQNSVSLRSRNLARLVNQLDGGEELVMVIPAAPLKLLATTEAPSTSTEILGRFTLRDWR